MCWYVEIDEENYLLIYELKYRSINIENIVTYRWGLRTIGKKDIVIRSFRDH